MNYTFLTKKRLSIFSFFLLFLLHFACSSESESPKEPELSERELLYKQVMEVHDAVMPKMSDLNRIKRQLKDKLEENAVTDKEMKSQMNLNIDELIAAENSMMDWMKAFKVPKKDDPDKEVIVYLNEEKLKIERVSDQMLSSLQNGTKLLAKLAKSE